MKSHSSIYALSSAPGRAGVAVVRISGPHAGMALNVIAAKRPKPRVAALRRIVHPTSGALLDRGLVLWMPGPHSFTGEDVAELHLHGGVAVVRAVLEALSLFPDMRPAEPGEFARRAFANGKLDLLQAEGLADLIDAETDAQRRQALAQSGGRLSERYDGWRHQLIEASALVEAAIDFSDEADVAHDAFQQARVQAETLRGEIERHLADGHRGEILRSGFRVVIAGPPNVGKSSLLNALARRDAAIVSAEAGTTRDPIEVRLDLEGLPVVVTDTAGIRETDGSVEREGIRRSVARAADAELILWLTDTGSPEVVLPQDLLPVADRVLPVLNKIDLLTGGQAQSLPDDMMAISVAKGSGLTDLTRRIASIAVERIGRLDEPLLTQDRHRERLGDAIAALDAFLAGDANQPELRAEDLRIAASAIGRITGRIDVEDVLDQVFGRFCIGK
ncbi:MAG: tRNA uridine-5-carboxymethylaminomethyl(34) synthesis GTPase MnmE [Hyphomicrobiaceae bacterium]